MSQNPVSLDTIDFIGNDLKRPECVLATREGSVYAADWRGGVSWIRPDGNVEFFIAKDAGFEVKPNGIALCRDGSFLLAHLGDSDGGLFRLHRDGTLETVITEIDGEPVPPSNFPLLDQQDRIWFTVSTRVHPRADDYRPEACTGFIGLVDEHGARIVADGLGYTNELQFDPSGRWLYVNETFARRLSRFRVHADGRLSGKETVAEFGAATYPDGLCFDVEGGIWITSIVSNRVIRVNPDGTQTVVLEDSDPQHLEWTEAAFQAREMGRSHLDNVKSRKLKNISSLAFGGPDLKTAYLGCLLGDRVSTFKTRVAGVPPIHWEFGF